VRDRRVLVTPLQGDLALVTGGAIGLGAAVAQELATQGATVVIADIDLVAAEQTAARLTAAGLPVSAVRIDVTEPESVRAAEAAIRERHGDISILVNNAGIAGVSRIGDDGDLATWDRVLEVNLSGAYYVTTVFLESLKRTRGRVVNVSSVVAFTSGFSSASYVASKGGIRSLTQMLARQLADHGIRVNAVAPGYFDTPMMAGLKANQETMDWVAMHCPMKRLGVPEEIAGPVAFLVSPAASFVNGVTLPVDGGYLVM
jgi:NAD(P)-dependent dehydrogenase (short-subunit alcohol dehydrogenase family)